MFGHRLATHDLRRATVGARTRPAENIHFHAIFEKIKRWKIENCREGNKQKSAEFH